MYLARVLITLLIPFVILALYLVVLADNDNPTRSKIVNLWWALGAVLGPFAILTAYILISRAMELRAGDWAVWTALGLGTTIGVILLNKLSLDRKVLVAWSIAYVPVFTAAQALYALVFVCAAFGDCL